MVKKRKAEPKITQGGINITGNVNIKNSKIAGRDNIEKDIHNINVVFSPVYRALKDNKTIAPSSKKTLEKNVKQIEQELKKGNKAEASFIQKRLENIRKMAPDIAEVLIASLQNPAAGISLAVKKVVTKFKTNQAT